MKLWDLATQEGIKKAEIRQANDSEKQTRTLNNRVTKEAWVYQKCNDLHEDMKADDIGLVIDALS